MKKVMYDDGKYENLFLIEEERKFEGLNLLNQYVEQHRNQSSERFRYLIDFDGKGNTILLILKFIGLKKK